MGKLSALVVCLWSISLVATGQTPPVPAEGENVSVADPNRVAPATTAEKGADAIHWKSLIREWWLYIALEHTERILKEPKTRRQLGGPFFRDWFDTVSVYRFDNWNDGGKLITSYLGHPAQGAIVQAIFWQNNDHVRFAEQDFHSAAYRRALIQAFAFAAVDAVLWKMGPLSESSIGNVGLPVQWWDRDCKALHIRCVARTGVSDMVMNEVGGTAMTIGFQWLDKHVQKQIEEHVQNRALISFTRILTNPTQSVANLVRFRKPWFRDNRR
jgi:hypothetical protein